MNVFGVGPADMIVIAVVALIFVGPERLPRLAADLARTIREIRKYTSSFASEFNEAIREIEKDIDRETAPARAEWKEVGEGLSSASQSLSDELRAAQADVGAAANPNGAASPAPAPAPAAKTAGEPQ